MQNKMNQAAEKSKKKKEKASAMQNIFENELYQISLIKNWGEDDSSISSSGSDSEIISTQADNQFALHYANENQNHLVSTWQEVLNLNLKNKRSKSSQYRTLLNKNDSSGVIDLEVVDIH